MLNYQRVHSHYWALPPSPSGEYGAGFKPLPRGEGRWRTCHAAIGEAMTAQWQQGIGSKSQNMSRL